ncbi:MAG: hypothetical protein ACI90V_009238, partial [Bacillariaceae sp.]
IIITIIKNRKITTIDTRPPHQQLPASLSGMKRKPLQSPTNEINASTLVVKPIPSTSITTPSLPFTENEIVDCCDLMSTLIVGEIYYFRGNGTSPENSTVKVEKEKENNSILSTSEGTCRQKISSTHKKYRIANMCIIAGMGYSC